MTGFVHILGGGTFSAVRNHLSLAAEAFGASALHLAALHDRSGHSTRAVLHLTRMADPHGLVPSVLRPHGVRPEDLYAGYQVPHTNADVGALIDRLVADPSTRAIVLNVALCDYDGSVGAVPSGRHAERLKTSQGVQAMALVPADKVIGRIRRERKDIFAVGFKTTCGEDLRAQYQQGLSLMKRNSLNLVLANDTGHRRNLVITPEEAYYGLTDDRDEALATLHRMMLARMDLTFTRSTVVDAPPVPWDDAHVPGTLRRVVDHLIARGAYKPFLGKTVGHFAYRAPDGNGLITSRRKSNFNELDRVGMVRIVPEGQDRVIAYGGKPSVGGQSQRIIFEQYPGLDFIAHAHVPLKPGAESVIPVRSQMLVECGSHECGRNTAEGLKEIEPGIHAVYLENHGPNVVFAPGVSAERVIGVFERFFDLDSKTGGVFDDAYAQATA